MRDVVKFDQSNASQRVMRPLHETKQKERDVGGFGVDSQSSGSSTTPSSWGFADILYAEDGRAPGTWGRARLEGAGGAAASLTSRSHTCAMCFFSLDVLGSSSKDGGLTAVQRHRHEAKLVRIGFAKTCADLTHRPRCG